MDWIALDIGGANLKAADGHGSVLRCPFPLWQRPSELPDALRVLLRDSPHADAIAVTMTGELADCFPTKAEGVRVILRAVEDAASGRRIRVYLTDGRWASPREVLQEPLLAAASNWHALARFAARYLNGRCGLLVDIGSTTCDIIPVVDGDPAARGRTDVERLIWGELVYTGVERSPVAAIVDRVPWRGQLCPVAQELFATAWDAYLLLNDLPEEPEARHTADGRPAMKEAARDRLARCICADRTMVDRHDAVRIAQAVAMAQVHRIAGAIVAIASRLPGAADSVVLSGKGEFLARRALEHAGLAAGVISLAETLGPDVSTAATAHALAVLAEETQGR